MAIAGDPSGVRHASEQVSDVTLGGVRQTAIPKNDSAALELVSGGHLNAPPVPSVDPDRLTCGVRVLQCSLRLRYAVTSGNARAKGTV